MKYINMSIVYWLYNFIKIILEIKIALISYILSKATSEAAKNNRLIGVISSHSALCWQYPSQSGVWANQMMVITINNSYWR